MKRSIIQLSTRTQGVSLPKEWLLKHNLEKGDILEAEDRENSITFSTLNKLVPTKQVSINLKGSNKATIYDAIVAAYRFGYDEITLEFDPTTIDIWRKDKVVETRQVVQNRCNQLIGFECVQLDDTSAVIRDIMGVNTEEFEVILRRMFLMLHTFGLDIHKGLKEKDEQLLEFVSEQYMGMLKYTRYCSRYLMKIGKGKNTPMYEKLISKLDLARISLRFLMKMHEDTKITDDYSNEVLDILECIIELFYDMYENFYNFSMEEVAKLFKRRQVLIDRAYVLSASKNRADAVISQRLIYVLNSISEIIHVSIVFNLEEK